MLDWNYRRLETAAGAVKISDYFPSSEVYRYVTEHTSPSDYLLIPYGGGMNFASGRPRPIFNTMLFGMEGVKKCRMPSWNGKQRAAAWPPGPVKLLKEGGTGFSLWTSKVPEGPFSATFSVGEAFFHTSMEIPAKYEQQDLNEIERRKPKLILARDAPRFGTNFSFGLVGDRACVYPRLVWVPDRPSWDPNYVYPRVDYITRNYRPAMRIGNMVILEPLH